MSEFFQRYKGIIILLLMVVAVAFFCTPIPFFSLQWIQSHIFGIPKAASPVITLPGEKLVGPILAFANPVYNVYLTNTLVATFLCYIILIILALIARGGVKEVPSGLANVLEFAVESLYNIAEGVVGARWARRIFPIAATVFLLILFANWMEMIPGVDSVGLLHHAEVGQKGYPAKPTFIKGVYYLDSNVEAIPGIEHAEGETAVEESANEAQGGHIDLSGPYIVTPFVRTASTDINFPLALAVVTFVAVQVFGVMALGGHYLAKFINTPALAKGGMGLMDFGVGLLELVLEPVKMVSLTFRLLGNIFGGAVLLFVLSGLVPYLLPTGLYLYEMFVGAIQAYVFFMLTLVYANVAMTGHGGEEEHH